MKTTETVSFSLPVKLLEQVDNKATELNISRSALLTAIISVSMKWVEEASKNGVLYFDTDSVQDKKNLLNSLYGKRG